jgi:hypothetical protein
MITPASIPIASDALLDRLQVEVLALRRLGMVNQAEGVQKAVIIVIKQVHEQLRGTHYQDLPSIEPEG